MTILDTFLTVFRVESDRSGFQKVAKSFKAIEGQILKIGTTLLTTFGGTKLILGTSRIVNELDGLSRSIGITVGELQSFMFVAESSGESADVMKGSLSQLTAALAKTARGAGDFGLTFARFGVNVRGGAGGLKNAAQLMRELNRVFQRLNRVQQFDLAKSLGLNDATIRILQQSPKEFDRLIKKSKTLGLITQKNVQNARKFTQALTELRTVLFRLSVNLVSKVLPPISKLLEKTEAIILRARDFSALFKAAAVALGLLTGWFIKARIAAIGLSSVRFLGVVGALTGIVLALDDIIGYFRGFNSVTGILVAKTKKWLLSIKLVRDFLKKIDEIFKKPKELVVKLVEEEQTKKKREKIPFDLLRDRTQRVLAPSGAGFGTKAFTQNLSVSVGGITVNGANASPKEIGENVAGQLATKLKNSINTFDSGIEQ